MKNVTVSLDETTYRRARLRAAEMDASLSALVRDFLNKLGGEETEFERLKRQEKELRARMAIELQGRPPFSAADRLSRDELYDRAAARTEAAAAARD